MCGKGLEARVCVLVQRGKKKETKGEGWGEEA